MTIVGLLQRFKDWLAGGSARDTNQRVARRKHPIQYVEKEVLDLIMHAAKNAHPNEFAGVLRAEDETITEILLVPGTVQGAAHAILKINQLPIDRSVVGVVHSHPSQSARPSQADIRLFGKHGHTHIIIHHPYNEHTWRCWDHRGEPVRLEVV